jgi:cell division protein FtsL
MYLINIINILLICLILSALSNEIKLHKERAVAVSRALDVLMNSNDYNKELDGPAVSTHRAIAKVSNVRKGRSSDG